MTNYVSAYTGTQIDARLTFGTVSGSSCEGNDIRLSDSRKPITCITIGTTGSKADYECDGVADDVQIQAAFDAASSGDEIVFLPGSYVLANTLTQIGKNLKLLGIGNVTISGNLNPCMSFSGTQITTQSLTSNATVGTRTVALTSAALVQAGDLIRIHNNVVWSPLDSVDNVTGEMYLVHSVNVNTVTLKDSLLRSYTTAASSAAIIYRPIQVIIENIELNNLDGSQDLAGIDLIFAKTSKIDKCKLARHGKCAIALYTCYDISVSNCTIKDSNTSNMGYAVVFYNGSAYIRMTNNYMGNCKHVIASGSNDNLGNNRGIIISGNTLVAADDSDSHVVDSHPNTIDYVVTNNIITVYTGWYAFLDGTQYSVFSNNVVWGNGVLRRGNITGGVHTVSNNIVEGGNLYHCGDAGVGKSLVITGNTVRNSPDSHGISLADESYENYSITNNTVDGCYYKGIYFVLPAAITTPATLLIANNIVRNCQGSGIYVTRESTSDVLYANICGNNVINSNLGNQSACGILIEDVYAANVGDNYVINYTGTMDTGIMEYGSSCNYSNIHHNTVKGATTPISKVGANTINLNNILLP